MGGTIMGNIFKKSLLLIILGMALLILQIAPAESMDFVLVGDAGNTADTQVMNDGTTGYGAVNYEYYIGIYEVTNAQYTEMLNAVAASDPYGLYSAGSIVQILLHRNRSKNGKILEDGRQLNSQNALPCH